MTRGRKPRPGRIVFVGSGPGDPGLLTTRAAAVLANAALVFTDPRPAKPGRRDRPGLGYPGGRKPSLLLIAVPARWPMLRPLSTLSGKCAAELLAGAD